MTWSEFAQLCNEYMRNHPHQRSGQAYFNAVYSKYPDVADHLRSTQYDPFHNDGAIAQFSMRAFELINERGE